MKCPICVDENLVMADRQGIEIDYCSKEPLNKVAQASEFINFTNQL